MSETSVTDGAEGVLQQRLTIVFQIFAYSAGPFRGGWSGLFA
jgi:hypothetical protein